MDKSSVKTLIESELKSLRSDAQSAVLSRFFKTGIGEYGYGDKFLGVRVPMVRNIVKRYKHSVNLDDIDSLTLSEWHEIRFAGFLCLIELYKKNRNSSIVEWYVDRLERGNNWDLVDVVCPNILGDWVTKNPSDDRIIYDLSDSSCLWRQRVSIVSTLMLIRNCRYDVTLKLARKFMTHSHDLMHKAVGWTLREVGKKDESILTDFLDCYGREMPRTTLRYAIERLPEPKRRYYLESTRLR